MFEELQKFKGVVARGSHLQPEVWLQWKGRQLSDGLNLEPASTKLPMQEPHAGCMLAFVIMNAPTCFNNLFILNFNRFLTQYTYLIVLHLISCFNQVKKYIYNL